MIDEVHSSQSGETSKHLKKSLSGDVIENEDGEVDDEGFPELEPVIDPAGYNVPLNLVMRAQ